MSAGHQGLVEAEGFVVGVGQASSLLPCGASRLEACSTLPDVGQQAVGDATGDGIADGRWRG